MRVVPGVAFTFVPSSDADQLAQYSQIGERARRQLVIDLGREVATHDADGPDLTRTRRNAIGESSQALSAVGIDMENEASLCSRSERAPGPWSGAPSHSGGGARRRGSQPPEITWG